MIRTIPKCYEFHPSERHRFSLSDATKLAYTRTTGIGVVLKADAAGLYPLDVDLVVATQVIDVGGLRAHRLVMPVVATPTGTAVDYRLNDGTDEHYWDGANWVIATDPAEWTSMADLQANYGSFSTAAKKIGFTARLTTTDAAKTPTLLRIVYSLDVSVLNFVDEYVYQTMIPYLKGAISPRVDWTAVGNGTTTVDITSALPSSSLTLSDVVEAYDHVGDPAHDVDILGGYDSGTKVLTLTSAVADGDTIYLRAVPDIAYAVSTHPDYNEISKVPTVVFRQYVETFAGESPELTTIVNYATGVAESVKAPRRVDYNLPIDIIADRASHVAAIGEALEEAVSEVGILAGAATGEEIRIDMLEGHSFFPRPGEDTILRGVTRLALSNCPKWFGAPVSGHGVTSPLTLNTTLT